MSGTSGGGNGPGAWITKSHVKEIKGHLRSQQLKQQQEGENDDTRPESGSGASENGYQKAYDSCMEILRRCKCAQEGAHVPTFVSFLLLEDDDDEVDTASQENPDKNEIFWNRLRSGALGSIDNSTVKTFALLFGQASRKVDDYLTAERCFDWILWSATEKQENVRNELHAWKGLADTLREAIAPPNSRPSAKDLESKFVLDKSIVMTSRRRERLIQGYDLLADSSREETQSSKQASYILKEADIFIRCGQLDQASACLEKLLDRCPYDSLESNTFLRLLDTCGMCALFMLLQNIDDQANLLIPLLDLLEAYCRFDSAEADDVESHNTKPIQRSELIEAVRLIVSRGHCEEQSQTAKYDVPSVLHRMTKLRNWLLGSSAPTTSSRQCQLLLAAAYFYCLYFSMKCKEANVLDVCLEERRNAHCVLESLNLDEVDSRTSLHTDVLFIFGPRSQEVYYSDQVLEGIVLLLGAFSADTGNIPKELALSCQRKLSAFTCSLSSVLDTSSLRCEGVEIDEVIHELFNSVALCCGTLPQETNSQLMYVPTPILRLTEYILEATFRRKRVSALSTRYMDQWGRLGLSRFAREGDYLDSHEPVQMLMDIFFHYFKHILVCNKASPSYWDIIIMEKFVQAVRHVTWFFTGSSLLVLDDGVCPSVNKLEHQLQFFCPLNVLAENGAKEWFQSSIRCVEFDTRGEILLHEALGAPEGWVPDDAPGRQLKLSGWILTAVRLCISYLPFPVNGLFETQGRYDFSSEIETTDSVWLTLSCACMELIVEWVLSSVDATVSAPLPYYIDVLATIRNAVTSLSSHSDTRPSFEALSDFTDLSIRFTLASQLNNMSAAINLSTEPMSKVQVPQLADKDLSNLKVSTGDNLFQRLPFVHRFGRYKLKQFLNDSNTIDGEEYLKLAQQALLAIANSGTMHCDTLASLADIFHERLKESIRRLELGSSMPERVIAMKERGEKLAKKGLGLFNQHAHAAKSLTDIRILWGSYKESIDFLDDFISLCGPMKSIWACLVNARLHEHGLTDNESSEKSLLRRYKSTDSENWVTESNIADRNEETLHQCVDYLHMMQRAGANGWKTWKQLAEVYLLLGKLTASQKAIANSLSLQVPSREERMTDRLRSSHVFSSDVSTEFMSSLQRPHRIALPQDAETHSYDVGSLFLAARVHSSLSQHKLAVIRYEMGLTLQPNSASALFGCAQCHLAIAKFHLEEGTVTLALNHINAGIARVSMLVGKIPIQAEGDHSGHFLRKYSDVSAAWDVLGELYSCVFHICPEMYGPEAALITLGIVPREQMINSSLYIDNDNFAFPTERMSNARSPFSEDTLPVYIGPRGRLCLQFSGVVTSFPSDNGSCYVNVSYGDADEMTRNCYATCATGAFSNAVRCEPDNADHWCDLGRSFWYQAQAIRAAAGVSSVPLLSVDCSTDTDKVRITRMQCRHIAGSIARRAVAAYEQAIKLAPRYARGWNGYGCSVGNPLVAQHALIRAVHLGGGGTALCNLGMVYIENGQLELAKSTLLQAQTHDPNNDSMWVGHGFVSEAQAMLATLGNEAKAPSTDFTRFRTRTAAAFISATDLTLSAFASVPASIYGANYVQPLRIGKSSGANFSPEGNTTDKTSDSSSLLYIGCTRAPTNAVALYANGLNEASSENYQVATKWTEACISRILIMRELGILGEHGDDRWIQSLLDKMLYNARVFRCWLQLCAHETNRQMGEEIAKRVQQITPCSSQDNRDDSKIQWSELHSLVYEIASHLGNKECSQDCGFLNLELQGQSQNVNAAKLLKYRLHSNATSGPASNEETNLLRKSNQIALARCVLDENGEAAAHHLETLLGSARNIDDSTARGSLAACLYLSNEDCLSLLKSGLCKTLRNYPWSYTSWARLGVLILNTCFSSNHNVFALSKACVNSFEASWKNMPRGRSETQNGTNELEGVHPYSVVPPYELLRLKAIASMYNGSFWTYRPAARYFHACPWKQSARDLFATEVSAIGRYFDESRGRKPISSTEYHLEQKHPLTATVEYLSEPGLETFVESRTVEDMLLTIHSALNRLTESSRVEELETKKSRQSLKIQIFRIEGCIRRAKAALNGSVSKFQESMLNENEVTHRSNLSLVDWRKYVLVDCINRAIQKLEMLRHRLSIPSST